MEPLESFADERLVARCIHCGGNTGTLDHSPSRIFLDKPHPANLPVVGACAKCNRGFSLDEEYVASLIECTLCGSADPAAMTREKIARALRHSPALAARLSAARRVTESGIVFAVEHDRVHKVVVKLARGHAAYELSEPQLREPASIGIAPLISESQEQRDAFENIPTSGVWPEVGSRAMQRIVAAWPDVITGGWVGVQSGRYRYAVVADRAILIRMVISEYLAAEVRWA